MNAKYNYYILLINILIVTIAIGQGNAESANAQDFEGMRLHILQSPQNGAIIQASSSEKDFPVTPNTVENDKVFHVVVIGDSIAWGAGLTKYDKYSYLVAKWIAEQSNRPVNVKVLAHTGATLERPLT
jgi:hypothetical protein